MAWSLERGVGALDAAHAADPRTPTEQGVPFELAYCRSVRSWVARLVDAPSEALQLAAAAQHLERWSIPRSDYPDGRQGYLAWRRDLGARQGRRAIEILVGEGCTPDLAERVGALVAKRAPLREPEMQALEDAACLVFLDEQIAAFATNYDDEALARILRKTWRKMSPAAHAIALDLALPERVVRLVSGLLATDPGPGG